MENNAFGRDKPKKYQLKNEQKSRNLCCWKNGGTKKAAKGV
jgi:hypothetical protein